MNDTVLFFISQSVIIVGAILLAYIRTHVAIARLQEQTGTIRDNTRGLKEDHYVLAEKVDGISRAVAELKGRVNATD